MQSPSSAFVEFAQVGKSYDGRTLAVEDFNLQVAAGEFVTLLGPSGCGKTTCLQMLAGFEDPTRGEIFLKGQPVSAIKPHKRNVGVVFQHYALFPHMTVAENLAFPLKVRGLSASDIHDQVNKALDMVQLREFAGRHPGQMSGGQQQRAAIARALVYEPDMVLMDEPLGALDRRLREEMQYEIRRLQQRLEVTMVYVTHDQGEAMAMSDRVAVMNGGRVEQIATPEELYEEPERTFVASFIGENNLLEGVVVACDESTCQVKIDSGVADGGTAGNGAAESGTVGNGTADSGTADSGTAGNGAADSAAAGNGTADNGTGGSGAALVSAFPVAVDGSGQRTSLAIRPERIAVNPPEGTYPNLFDARVQDMIFMGDHLRLHTELLGRWPVVVKIPNTVGHGAVLPGDTVKLGWLLTDCRALDSIGGASA